MKDVEAKEVNQEVSITVDDLIFEIGNLTVKDMLAKKEKKVFTEAIVVLQSRIPELDKIKTELLDKTAKIEKSNMLYVTNNRNLDIALVGLRQDLAKIKGNMVTLKRTLAEVRKDRASLKRKLNRK